MKKILSIIIVLYGTCGVSFADDPELVLNCRMLEGDVKTDIFFERDLNQAFLFKVLKKNKKEIVFKYNNSSEGIYKFNRDTKILLSPGNDGKGNPKIVKSICDGSKAPKRVVEKSNMNEAWKVDGKFIKPECFDHIWVSGDRYETFYDEYFAKPTGSHWDDPNFLKFIYEVGMYLNKEVPLNHSIDPDWVGIPEISLTKQLEGCLTENPETTVRFNDEFSSSSTVAYKVMHNFDRYIAKELAPYIDQKFESVKQVEIVEWGGGSMGPQTYIVVFGVLELEGKKVLLPLRNKSILSEIKKRDSFFEPTGRYSYEAEFDLNDNITEIININDFKQIASSDGCFKINDFKRDGKIYDFLRKKNLKKYCNKIRFFDDIDWFLNQTKFKNNKDLIFNDKEHRFSNLIRSQVPDIQVPWSDKPYSLSEELIDSITLEDDIQYLNNRKQIVVSGCVYKFCSQKGFIFVYKNNFIGLIQHDNKDYSAQNFLVFSKNHKSLNDLPDNFFKAVTSWIEKTNSQMGFDVIKPAAVRFLGSDNKINETENLFVKKKKIKEVEIVQGFKGVSEKRVAMKAEALTKNYNAELFDLINKKDTARNILEGREFEYALSKEINDKFIDFKFEGKDRYSFLNEQFYYLLSHSSKKAYEVDINNDDFFIITGCADPSCVEAGLLYIDKKNKVVIGSTNSKYFSEITNTDVGAMFVFSKKISELKKLPNDFLVKFTKLTAKISNLNNRKGSMYFMGPNNKIRNITQLEILDLDINE